MGEFFDANGYKLEDIIIENAAPEIEKYCEEAYQKLLKYANSCIDDFYNDYPPEGGEPKYYVRGYNLYVDKGGLVGVPVKKDSKKVWSFGLSQQANIKTSNDDPEFVYNGAMNLGYHGTSSIYVSDSPWDKIKDYYYALKL